MVVNSSAGSKTPKGPKPLPTIVRPSNKQLISVGYESVGNSGGPTTTTLVTFPASKSLNQISDENRIIPIGIPITVSDDNVSGIVNTVTEAPISKIEEDSEPKNIPTFTTPTLKRPTTIFTIYSSSNLSPKSSNFSTPIQSKSSANLRQEFFENFNIPKIQEPKGILGAGSGGSSKDLTLVSTPTFGGIGTYRFAGLERLSGNRSSVYETPVRFYPLGNVGVIVGSGGGGGDDNCLLNDDDNLCGKDDEDCRQPRSRSVSARRDVSFLFFSSGRVFLLNELIFLFFRSLKFFFHLFC